MKSPNFICVAKNKYKDTNVWHKTRRASSPISRQVDGGKNKITFLQHHNLIFKKMHVATLKII